MNEPKSVSDLLAQRPRRADARRNYEKLISAARDVFAEDGSAATGGSGVSIPRQFRNVA